LNPDALDLSSRLLPPVVYFPQPTLVPQRLLMNATESLSLADLRRLAACGGDGPDTIYAGVVQTPELSTDPDAAESIRSHGSLTLTRTVFVNTDNQGNEVGRTVSWWATVAGLTFHADDDGWVYVDGPDGRVTIHNPADARLKRKAFAATVWAGETEPDPDRAGMRWPAGKSKRYATYAALVTARNAAQQRGTHGRVPDAVASLLGLTPMIDKRKPTTTITVSDIVEPFGLSTRRTGQRYQLRLDEATAKRLHGENAGSKQAVLRYDVAVEATDENLGQAAMQLLREFDTETMVTVVGLLMNANDTGNRLQRIGAADLARVRGKQLASARDTKVFGRMVKMLSEVIIEVRPTSGDGATARLNLFARQGEVVVRGGERLPLVTLNETLYRAMKSTGHGILMDRTMVTADLNAHEWEVRIAMALDVQWSLGWVVNGYAKGKRLKRSAAQLLADAGIPYDFKAERTKRGVAAVRLKLAGTFDRMVGLGWLKSWKRVKEGTDPSADVYEFVPADTHARSLTAHRQPALEAAAKRPAKMARGGT
jgi:hypothetical protein